MPTSGTVSFSMNRDALIASSLRLMGVLGQGDTPTTEDYTNCSQALNIMIKSLMTSGIPLWTQEGLVVPLTTNKFSYTIGMSGADITYFKPLRVISAYIRYIPNNSDVTLYQLSREEYDALGKKDTASIPNSFFYSPDIDVGTIYFFGVPTDSTRLVVLNFQRPIQDMNAASDLFDFPNEWYQCLKWNLAAELCPEYGVPEAALNRIDLKSFKYKEDLISWSQEEASVYFQPNTKYGRNR